VLITLFSLFAHQKFPKKGKNAEEPLPRKQQEECIQRILEILGAKGFIHRTNRVHMTKRIHDLLGRLQMNERDRKLLLALFSKGVEKKP
jgi:tRNA C32,U32 (ribose-2'-O)-methylase TrmJ